MTRGAVDVGLLDPATGDAARLVGDAAYLAAMVDVEAALLAALADVGAAPASALTVDLGPVVAGLDATVLGAAGRAGGNPVIPLLARLRDALPDELRDVLHFGATSQDVLDSATMLVASRARASLVVTLAPVLDRLAVLAEEHRRTPVAGRTLGQQAAPTTFGLRVAVLLDGVLRAARSLEALELPAQLGGSVGTLAVLVDTLGEDGAARVRRAFADRLGLADRPTVWHVERGPVAELGARLAVLVGALGRIGLELAQGARSEIGELDVVLPEGEGGSSALPQKRNPVAAVLLVAGARRAPALAATLLGAQLALDERPAGDWHAEWQPLRELLRLALEGTALARDAVESLAVDADRMRANLDLTHGALHAERAQWALVPTVGRTRAAALVRDALAAPDFVAALLDRVGEDPALVERIRAVTTPGGSVGLSDRIIDAVVADLRGRA